MTDPNSVREAVFSKTRITREEWSLTVPATPEEISRMDYAVSEARQWVVGKEDARSDVTPLVFGIRDGMITLSYTYVEDD